MYQTPVPHADDGSVISPDEAGPLRRAMALLRVAAASLLLAPACGVAALPVSALPPRLLLPALDATLTLDDPAVDVTAESAGLLASLSLQQSAGTLEVEGRSWPALAIARSFMGGAVLHKTFVRAEDRFYLLWVYCVDGRVTSIFIEDSLFGYTRHADATGICAEVRRSSPSEVHFPAFDIAWPQVSGLFQVTGDSLQLPRGAPGVVRYGGALQTVVTFAMVNCSMCATAGWYELHSLLWNPISATVSAGIFYLFADRVVLEWVMDLKTMKFLSGAQYGASWTIFPDPF